MNTGARLTLSGFGLLFAGALATAGAATLPIVGPKSGLLTLAGGSVVIVAILSRRPKEVFFAAYLLALTYNRFFFSFGGIFGHNGYPGPYWILADPFLLLMFATSAIEPTEPERRPRYGTPAPGILPTLFLLAGCLISAIAAARPDWAFIETLRVVKFALVLVWLHRNMTPRLWMTAIVTLGVSVVLQSALGTLQVVTHGGTSLLAMIGLHSDVPVPKSAIEIENRARGTLGHPNFLAPYLLMLVPGAFGGMMFSRQNTVRALCGLVTLVGVAGIILTESRLPIALLIATLATIAALAVAARALSLRAALGGAIITTTFAIAVVLPFINHIEQRLFGDLSQSIDFRDEYNEVALLLWNESPLLGVGLNNTMLQLHNQPQLYGKLAIGLDLFRDLPDVRPPSVHNVYLLILSETGIVGLVAFIVLLGAVLRRGVIASAATSGAVHGLCVGLTVGLAAQYLQQIMDFSLWGDASWYTFATLAALLGAAPTQAPQLR